jgi:hypothetical protein
VAATAVVAVGASAGAAPSHQPDPVACSNHAGRHTLSVRLHDLVERFRLPPHIAHQVGPGVPHVFESRTPPELAIERRIDEITVVDQTPEAFLFPDPFGEQPDRAPVACGPQPTTANTDSVLIRRGKHTDSAKLELSLRYGALAPGFTDEGDGSSEVEVDARLGHGSAYVEMTRGADTMTVKRPQVEPGPTLVNLNAGEVAPDGDLVVGGQAPVVVDAAGGDDRLTSSVPAQDLDDEVYALLAGGQGADVLAGGEGSDFFLNGPGADIVKAGAGRDIVLAFGHAPDRIDCGPGFDVVFLSRAEHHLHGCEERDGERGLSSNPEDYVGKRRLARPLRR